jgi:hypothetical protein
MSRPTKAALVRDVSTSRAYDYNIEVCLRKSSMRNGNRDTDTLGEGNNYDRRTSQLSCRDTSLLDRVTTETI